MTQIGAVLTKSHVVVVYQGLIVTLDKHRKLGELGFTLYESTKLLYWNTTVTARYLFVKFSVNMIHMHYYTG